MATEMNVDAERAAFEAWYVAAAGESRKFMLGLNTDGTYSYGETEGMWEAWQGRAAQPADVGAGELPPLPARDGDWAGDSWWTAARANTCALRMSAKPSQLIASGRKHASCT